MKLLFIFAHFVAIAKGLMCYSCTGASSHQQCNEKLQQCPDWTSCMTVTRIMNRKAVITKTCKQSAACYDHMKHNGIECKTETSFSACYFCCNTDRCNAGREEDIAERMDRNTRSGLQFATTRSPAPVYYNNSTMSLSATAEVMLAIGGENGNASALSDAPSRPLPSVEDQSQISSAAKNKSGPSDTSSLIRRCGVPNMSQATFTRIDYWPTGFVGYVVLQSTKLVSNGWGLLIVFTSSIPRDASFSSGNSRLASRSDDGRSILLLNEKHNFDLSGVEAYGFTITLENMPKYYPIQNYSAIIGLYDHSLTDGMCDYRDIPSVATSSNSSRSAQNSITSESDNGQTPRCSALQSPDGFALKKKVSSSDDRIHFKGLISINKITRITNRDWMLKIVFNRPVSGIEVWKMFITNSSNNGIVWMMSPMAWNRINHREFTFELSGKSFGKAHLTAAVYICVDGYVPDLSVPPDVEFPGGSSYNDVKFTSPSSSSLEGDFVTTTPSSPCRGLQQPEGFKLKSSGYVTGRGVSFTATVSITSSIVDFAREWTLKLVFNKEITDIEVWKAYPSERSDDRRVWLLTPMPWTEVLKGEFHFEFIGYTPGPLPPSAAVYLCVDGYKPDVFIPADVGYQSNFQSAEANNAGRTDILPTSSILHVIVNRCARPSGKLPHRSAETKIKFVPSSDNTKYDYNEVLHKSLLFYEAQRSGKLPTNNRIPWRGDSGIKDGCDVGIDLTGGYYDGGMHNKNGLHMAATSTIVSWGMILFKDAYDDAGEWENAIDMVKWATDYFLKAHTSKYELYGYVGVEEVDRGTWVRAEEAEDRRASYKINPQRPGSDLAGETSAALAAAYLLFRNEDGAYADKLLDHAKGLYQFAKEYRGRYDVSIPVAATYYGSRGYEDELVWACLWLYAATLRKSYLTECEAMYSDFRLNRNPDVFSWEDKTAGVQLLLASFTGNKTYINNVENFLDYFTRQVPKTPGGMVFFDPWGANRYAANAAFIALATSAMINPPDRYYRQFAQDQINFMLGDSGRSYVVGFGRNPPTKPHHSGSSCPRWTYSNPPKCDWSSFDSPYPNPHTLYGALVAGPNLYGEYADDRADSMANEIACNYNAGFQSAVAGLKHYVIEDRLS